MDLVTREGFNLLRSSDGELGHAVDDGWTFSPGKSLILVQFLAIVHETSQLIAIKVWVDIVNRMTCIFTGQKEFGAASMFIQILRVVQRCAHVFFSAHNQEGRMNTFYKRLVCKSRIREKAFWINVEHWKFFAR